MRAGTPSLGREIIAALALSLAGAATLAALAPLIGTTFAARFVFAALGLAYVLYVLGTSAERVGRLTTVALWTAGAAAVFTVNAPLFVYALTHVALAWLARSLYRYSSVLPALADFGLSLLGAAFAVWAAQRSGSAWLAFWCFFLVQSLHVFVPRSLGATASEASERHDAFADAHRAAEAAVRRLSSAR